jgi:hypothetical protein
MKLLMENWSKFLNEESKDKLGSEVSDAAQAELDNPYTFEQIEEMVRQELEERCWKGHEETPGVEPYAPGSCRVQKEELDEAELEEGGKCTGPTQKASSTSKGKKWMQCVKNPDGKGYKRIHWGQKGVRVTGDSGNTKRKKSFRARHGCSDAKAGTAKYMACKDW